jgi:vacuolar-type H+-ATPase subunit I/STV1
VMEWMVLLFRVPAEPSRYRVAVWRELRRTGAVSLGQSAWLAPDAPAFADGIARAVQLVEAAGGQALVLAASGRQPADAQRLAAVYTAAREAEWTEFLAECGKYLAEIDKEIATAKLTLAELDEEEQSLEQLRRWHRELRRRDVLGAPSAADADQRLKECEAKLEDYTQRVFHAVAGQ